MSRLDEMKHLYTGIKKRMDAIELLIAKMEKEESEAQLAALNNPPITGRPFAVGVNEPEEGQTVWRIGLMGQPYNKAYEACGDLSQLKRGELYPTEADCREGNRREEIRKRYEAMGRTFIYGSDNWYAWMGTRGVRLDCSSYYNHGLAYFNTPELCQTAIDTINREYGPGAFEWAMFNVGDKSLDKQG